MKKHLLLFALLLLISGAMFGQTSHIKVSAKPNVGGSPTIDDTSLQEADIPNGQTCIVHANKADGYTFINWTEENGEPVIDTLALEDYPFTVDGDRILTANFEPSTYNVTLHTNGGTINSGDVNTYIYGVGATLPTDVTRTGYTFDGWYDNDELLGHPVTIISTTDTSDKEFWAKWNANTYNVTLHTNGGTINSGDVNTYIYGEGATLPTDVTYTGYTFDGWYDNDELTGDPVTVISTTDTGDKEFWAKWIANSYEITASSNNDAWGTVTGSGSYPYSSTCVLQAIANPGYTFSHWQDGNTDNPRSVTVTDDLDFTAYFTVKSYTITAEANPTEGGNVIGGGTFNYGTSCTLTATANTGYTFTNWTKNDTVVSSNTTYIFPVVETARYVANFTQIQQFTITATAEPTEGGTVEGDGIYAPDVICTLKARPKSGYTFKNWTENDVVVSTDASYSFMVESDRNLVANFTKHSSINNIQAIQPKYHDGYILILVYPNPDDEDYEYQWQYSMDDVGKYNDLKEGTYDKQYYYKGGPLNNGYYKVRINRKGENDYAYTEAYHITNNDNGLHIYPNPSRRGNSIKVVKDYDAPAQLTIYSTDGRLLHTQTVINNEATIGICLPQGVYVVYLTNSEGYTKEGKLIIH